MGACGVKIEVEYLIFYFLVDTVDGRGIFYERRVVSQKKTIISTVFIIINAERRIHQKR